MSHNTPVSPRPLSHLSQVQRRVMNAAQLRAHGVAAAVARERCRPGGGWQQVLPGVFLLHPAPPGAEERVHAALLYAARPPAPGADGDASYGGSGDAMVTGLAALALRGFASVPALSALERIDVLVPRTRRLRSVSFARVLRGARLPDPELVHGVAVAPVPRAVADAVAWLTDAGTVHGILAEVLCGGHGDPAAVMAELCRERLLDAPVIAEAVASLVDGDRRLAEGLLHRMVHDHRLPEPLWNVDLRLPGGPHLGPVDAYWPEHAVALELDTRAPRADVRPWAEDTLWSDPAHRPDHLTRLGITVVQLSPQALCRSPQDQATLVRAALMVAADLEPAAYVRVLPR